jgi:endoglucanase
MAEKYAMLPNVLWEICNEPSSAGLTEVQSGTPGVSNPGHYTTWTELTAYAKEVIPIIKAKNPNAIILMGTPSWSTLGISTNGADAWKEIANNRLSYSNILYVIHYYANSHSFQSSFEDASTMAGPFVPSGSNVTATGKLVYKWLSEPVDTWSKHPAR